MHYQERKVGFTINYTTPQQQRTQSTLTVNQYSHCRAYDSPAQRSRVTPNRNFMDSSLSNFKCEANELQNTSSTDKSFGKSSLGKRRHFLTVVSRLPKMKAPLFESSSNIPRR